MTSRGKHVYLSPDTFPELRKFVASSVFQLRDHYDWRAKWHRRFFRSTGILVIVASSSLPLLVSADYPVKEATLSSVGVLIAVLTGMRAFYRWDQNWALLRRTHFELAQLCTQWELDLAQAAELAEAGNAAAYEATRKLVEGVNSIRSRETESYFREIEFPPAVPR